jgi:tyrosyl-tRNA synthetase
VAQKYQSDFMNIMAERGFVQDCTSYEGLDAALSEKSQTAYIGFDCTAPSLHVGSLVQIMMLRWLQKTGHKPIVLMGGGTTKIGDPSGKDTARQYLDDAAISENMAGIKQVFAKYINFDNATMVNNADWLDGLEYIAFLREYGRHFSINRMLTFDSVRLRLEREQPLSFLEFNYMLLQAYDFLELSNRYGCVLQMGGSDQWGNIVNGIDLTRRVAGREVFGLTTPLLTTSDGKKMGKTAQGAVWLNEDMLSVYDFWQFWRNTTDADVGRFLRLFTERPIQEIEQLERLQGSEINEAKILLANDVTTLAHGAEAAQKAERTAQETFSGSGISHDLPTFEITKETTLLQALTLSGLAKSGKDAKRLVAENAIKMNDEPTQDPAYVFEEKDFQSGVAKLSAGKKRHVLLQLIG